MRQICIGHLAVACAFIVRAGVASAQPATLYTPASSFNVTEDVVSTTVFHWFRSFDGQRTGPWRPLEGRENWTGDVAFWKRQIKDIMDADIQMMYVHLIPPDPYTVHEDIRGNLFRAAGELRAQGYDVPKIAPFLDPPITWSLKPRIDLATQAGKDEFVGEYKRFFQQYYANNPDPYATDYLAKFRVNNVDKVVLDTWHLLEVNPQTNEGQIYNRAALTRADVESRIAAEFAAQHPVFGNGVYMVGTALNNSNVSWADERLVQFEVNEYFRRDTNSSSTARTVQLKAGYWDQNIRDPGSQLRRNGGTDYDAAWARVNQSANANLRRVNIESWNEYDEGSGIYAANPGDPYIDPSNHSGNTDKWSNTNNPRQYIDATAKGARLFNDIPDRDAKVLWHDFPNVMYAGSTRNVSVIVRNAGDLEWTAAQGYKFGQQEFVPGEVTFGDARFLIDDTQDEIPLYGGIFRGRPKTFDINIAAPGTVGDYTTHWGMVQENVAWFGEVLTIPIHVLPSLYGDADIDGDVDLSDIGALASNFGRASGADWMMGDFDSDGDVDLNDLGRLSGNYNGGALQANSNFQALIAVPEPTMAGSVAFAAALLGLRRPGRRGVTE